MDIGERGGLSSALEDLVALAHVAGMVVSRQQEDQARELKAAVAALGQRAHAGTLDAAAVRPTLAGAVAMLRGYVAADHHQATALTESHRLISAAVATPPSTAAAASAPTAPGSPADPEPDLTAAAQSFTADAEKSARTMFLLYVCGAGLAMLALVLHWLLVLDRAQRSASGDVLVQSLPYLFLLGLSIFVMSQANQQRRTTEELRRVARQLGTLPGYLNYLTPLPANTQALLRGSLMQRLFPRVTEDDLLREPDSFPHSQDLLKTITGPPSAGS